MRNSLGRYDGMFKNGLKDGSGVHTLADASVYVESFASLLFCNNQSDTAAASARACGTARA